ncbi:WW domain protein [Paragonimus heterotremus]|uniref:WW domain protein n=1 Tax=Paragonimus heterotremus TaxID=100268 RepID=A0A8J4TMP8_9TREM|nr:WW domain protein [Paragonimus heterotremus]
MMQKKFEKLPGLSNVSGKYTKKYPTDLYSPNRRSSDTLSSGLNSASAVGSPTQNRPVLPGIDSTESTCRPTVSATRTILTSEPTALIKDSFTPTTDYRRINSATPSTVRQSVNVSSPSWPSCLSSASADGKLCSTNIPVKPPENLRRMRKSSEIVKSSSFGSVTNFNQKPTGIILATPASQNKELSISRNMDVNNNGDPVSRSGVSRQQGPSTPYPVRQSYRSTSSRLDSGAYISSSTSSAVPSVHPHSRNTCEHAQQKPLAVNSRPSVLVRPINLFVQSNSSATNASDNSSLGFREPFCRQSYIPLKNYPCLDSSSSSQVTTFPSWQLSGHPHNTRLTQLGYNPTSLERMPARSLIASRSMPGTASCVSHNAYGFPQDSSVDSETGGMSTSSSCSIKAQGSADLQRFLSHNPQGNAGFTSQRPSVSRFYGAQPRHSSSGSGYPPMQIVAFPGPQYTQCALEQYLSDLITGECSSSLVDLGSRARGTCARSTNNDSTQVDTSSQLDHMEQIEPLRFLERRIENALRGVHKSDMQHSASLTGGFPVRANRDRRYSFSIQQTSQLPTLGNLPYTARHLEPETEPKSFTTALDSSDSGDRKGILEQFSESELQYLLKAVRDLLDLRAHSSSTSANGVGEDLHSSVVTGQYSGRPVDLGKSVCDGNYAESGIGRTGSHDSSVCSRTSSRSNSAARNPSAYGPILVDDRSSSDVPAGPAGTECDPSSADLMHKRLPLGFQHFKRYLDNKFGPDHNHHQQQQQQQQPQQNSSYRPSERPSPSVSDLGDSDNIRLAETVLPCCQWGINQINSTENKYQETSFVRSEAGRDRQPDCVRSPSSFHGCVTYPQPFDESRTVGTAYPNQEYMSSSQPFTIQETGIADIQTRAEEAAFTNQRYPPSVEESLMPGSIGSPCSSAVANNWGTTIRHTDPTNSSDYGDTLDHVPQTYDTTSPSHTHTSYLPFHQRSYCSTPEVPGSYVSNPVIDPARFRWAPHVSQCYWWSHAVADHGRSCHPPYNPCAHQHSTTSVDFHPQDCCPFGLECYQTTYHSPWLRAQYASSCTVPSAQLRYADVTHLDAADESGLNTSAAHFATYAVLAPRHNVDSIAYDTSVASDTAQAHANWDNPSVYPGYHRTPYPFPMTHDPCMWSSNAAWSPLVPHYPPILSPYYFRMPRSGSAGAGFGCSIDAGGVGNNVSGPVIGSLSHQRMVRERSVGPDLNCYAQQQQPHYPPPHHYHQPQPVPRSVHRCLGPRCPGLAAYHQSSQVPTELSSPTAQSPSAVLGRPMSNSLSANDLAGYRSKTAMELRTIKSSFDLSPDLPCEPTLALLDCSDFYSKIAAFIHWDNSLQLAVPNGWSERRSSLGRTYYTCDQTRQTSWQHPTLGLHVPLGWERVDSFPNGVYYQNLLIPHCQRHHPNLWLPGPLKDPAVESEGFFSDLRYLQSSMRHIVTVNCPELDAYKNTTSTTEEKVFVNLFQQLDVETMVELTRVLDQLFYEELHALIVFFEQERLRIVSSMFQLQHSDHIFSSVEQS